MREERGEVVGDEVEQIIGLGRRRRRRRGGGGGGGGGCSGSRRHHLTTPAPAAICCKKADGIGENSIIAKGRSVGRWRHRNWQQAG